MATKRNNENPLHRDFGLWSNTRFVLNRARRYCPVIFPLGLASLFFGSVQGYLSGFISKYIIDVLTAELPAADKQYQLLSVLLISLLVSLFIYFGSVVTGCKIWPRFIRVRIGVIHERVAKAMRMNYELLEKTDVLNLHQRATTATDDNSSGFEGMLHILQDLGTSLVTAIVTFVAVVVLDYRLILAITVLAVLSFLYYRALLKRDKKKVWDRLAPVWRKINYMSRVTQQPVYAKDIRLFGMIPFLLKKQQAVFETREERIDYHKNLWNRHTFFAQAISLITRILTYTVLYYAVLREINPLSIGSFTLYLGLADAFSNALIASVITARLPCKWMTFAPSWS